MTAPALVVDDIWKSYGDVQALAGVTFEALAGEVVGILGRNGAGKTTLMSIVAGLRRPDRGTVQLGGLDAHRHRDHAAEFIGLAPQEIGIYPRLSAADNLRYFAELAGVRPRHVSEAIEEVADAVEIVHLLDRKAGVLSGGEKRRLHTAIALFGSPKLLLLDEPTAGSDVQTRARLLSLVRKRAEAGSAVCYSTHYVPEIEALSGTVAIIDRGEVLVRGNVESIVAARARSTIRIDLNCNPGDAFVEFGGQVDGSSVVVSHDDPDAVLPALISRLPEGVKLLGISVARPSLETVLLEVIARDSAPGGALER